jgi:hypothetical protein
MCLGIVAGIVSGVGGAISSLSAASGYKAQAAADDKASQQQLAAGAYQSARKKEQVERNLGEQRAATSANGLANTGTSLAMQEESAMEGQMDVDAIRWNAKAQADNLHYKARIDRANASSATLAAPFNFLSPVLGSVAKYGDDMFGAAA